MASLADLFNPTFLMFLGILVLVAALLVVYFESKIREQNHKISSMLSLVSTMAENMNEMKMELNHLIVKDQDIIGGRAMNVQTNLGNHVFNNLIEVSDDEDTDEDTNEDANEDDGSNTIIELNEVLDIDSDSDMDLDEDGDIDAETDSEESFIETSNVDVKLITIHMKENADETMSHEDNAEELEPIEDIIDYASNDEIPEVAQDYVEEVLNLQYDESIEESVKEEPLKETVQINLGNETTIVESIDYKKLQLPKLRSIAVEKGLVTNTDVNKFKKPELLKLLGAE
jgi:hypothetical protein